LAQCHIGNFRRRARLCRLGEIDLALASTNPSASPIWPPTGFALTTVLLLGYRIWPAIFVAAFIVNVTTAGSVATSPAIAMGNTLESAVGATIINRWSHGVGTFETPAGVGRFAATCLITTPKVEGRALPHQTIRGSVIW
jgi:integral membrane sensor domain MASE1